MTRRRHPGRATDIQPASDLTLDEVALRCFRNAMRAAEPRAHARATIEEVEALPPDWLPDDEEPERLGEVAQRIVDDLATAPAMGVAEALALLRAFDETRH